MKNRVLSPEDIQETLKEIDEIFQKERIESNRHICSSLLLEEIMYIYQSALGKKNTMQFVTRKKKEKLSVILSFPGEEFDPNTDKNAIVYKHILAQAEDTPVRNYRAGVNIITLELPLYNTTSRDLAFSWKYTKKKKNIFFLGILSQLTAMLLNIIGSFLVARLIIHYTNNMAHQAILTAVGIFILSVLEQGVMYVASMSYNRVSYTILESIQVDMVSSVLGIRTNTMTSYGSGLFVQRMTSDTATFAAGLNTVMDLMIQIGTFVGTLIAILLVNYKVFLFELFILVLLYLVQHYGANKLIDSDRIARKASEKYSGFITEIVRGFSDIRTLHCEDSMQNELKDRIIDSSEKQYALGSKRWGFRFLTSLVSNIGTLVVMILLVIYIATDSMTPAFAIVIFNYHTKLGPNVIVTIDKFTDFYTKFRLSCERINSLIFGQQFTKESFGTVKKEQIDGKIEFRDVDFSYKRRQNEFLTNRKTLKNISFKIESKQTAAFVGESGCGKSTIIKLLDKLYLPNSGTILLDDIDINDLDKDTLRNSIAIINQNPYVFHSTIRKNLQYVKPDLTEEEMISVCKAACIHDDITKMEDGYDTLLGEGGIDISGGQKQRLAIARGLLCNASIFILDEATSALDNNTQSKVLEAIKNIGKNHTVLLIAHRLSTVVDSDVIFLIGDGHVLASGTHEELMEKSADYHKLYQAEATNRTV